MDAVLMNLVGDIPPITKVWTIGCVGVSVLTSTQIIDATKTLYNFDLVFKKGQYGRLLYSLFDYGDFNWNTMLNLYITTTHLTMLENSFNDKNRYVWYIMVLIGAILSMSTIEQPLSSLGNILQENLVYYNLKKNGSQLQFQLIGGIDISPLLIPIYMNAFMYFVYKRSIFQISMNFAPAHLLFYFDDIIKLIYNIDLCKPPTDWSFTRNNQVQQTNENENLNDNALEPIPTEAHHEPEAIIASEEAEIIEPLNTNGGETMTTAAQIHPINENVQTNVNNVTNDSTN